MTDIVKRLRAVPSQRTDANNRALCAEAAAEIDRLRNTIQNCPPVSESEYVRRLEADIVRLEAIVASGKLDPAQVWPS